MIPKHWQIASLDELFVFIGGGTPSKRTPAYWDGEIPWASVKDIKSKYINSTSDHISQIGVNNSSTVVSNRDDVLLITRISPGKASISKTNIAINQDLKIVKRFGGISALFTYYLFEAHRDLILNQSSGTTVKGIRVSDFKNIFVPLPPLNEQQLIVEKIEELFSELDKSIESLEKTKKQLSVYKFVLLNNAFEGKLTEEWRKNNSELSGINELKAVKKRRKEMVISQGPILGKTLPFDFELKKHTEIPSWTIAKLDKLVTIAARVGWKGLKKDEYTDSGPLFLSVHSLNYGKTVDFRQVNHITQERYEESPEIILRENDILLCKDGAGIGKVGIVKRLPSPATINSSLLIVRGNEVFLPDFLYYLFLGPKLQRIVMDRISGSAIPHLFQRDIREFMLDVPPMKEQQQIVIEIERHLTLVEHLEENIINTTQNIEALRSSILKKAFAGKLIGNETSNQSVAELLFKITLEKEKYILKQKEQIKNRIPKARIMEEVLSIEEVLRQSEDPISAKEVWQRSKHKYDIEEFYKELKLLGATIKEIRSETESLLTIVK